MILELIAFLCILSLFFYSLCVIAETYICNDGEWEGECLPIVLFILSLISCTLLWIHLMKPTAIDVYKGETTLEITYKDGVPIDSTVVWKYDK